MATPASPLPQQAPQQTLAQMVRAKNPGAYDDMDDPTLESKVLAKYPQYSDLPRTNTGTPITNNISMRAAPSELSQMGQEASNIGHAAVNSRFPWVHPFDALGATANAGAQEIQRNAPSSITELLLGGQAAGQPMGTRSGVLNNPVTQMMASAVPLPWMGGRVATSIQNPETRGVISRGFQTAKNAVGDFMRDPVTGKLKPITKELARAGGAATGYAAGKDSGHGMEGMLIGGVAGPGMADAMLPESQVAREAQTAIQTAKLSKQAEMEARRAGQSAPGPWNPAAARQAYKASQVPAPETPFTSYGPTRVNPEQIKTLNPPEITPASAGPPSASEQQFSGSEGRAATWTNEAVMSLAKQGNREAIAQAVRRGLPLPENARYIMGSPDYPRAVYNPRETTSFEPEGTQIRNMERNPASSRKRILLPWEAKK
jgi:hypothetical protein